MPAWLRRCVQNSTPVASASTASPSTPPTKAARRSAWSIVCSSSELEAARVRELEAPTPLASMRRRLLPSSFTSPSGTQCGETHLVRVRVRVRVRVS